MAAASQESHSKGFQKYCNGVTVVEFVLGAKILQKYNIINVKFLPQFDCCDMIKED